MSEIDTADLYARYGKDTTRINGQEARADVLALLGLLAAAELARETVARERDRLIATRADAVRLLPALRAQVDAGAAAHPELGPFTDEDVMATVIVAASDVRHLLDQEKERTAQLTQALNVSRLAAEGWEKRAADAGLQVAQLRAELDRIRRQDGATAEDRRAYTDGEDDGTELCRLCDSVEIAIAALAATEPGR